MTMSSVVVQIAACLVALSVAGTDAAPLRGRQATDLAMGISNGSSTELMPPAYTNVVGTEAAAAVIATVTPPAPPTVGNLRISAGLGSNGAANIPRDSDVFTTFDVRPDANENIRGFQSALPWTSQSVTASLGVPSVDSNPHITTGTITNDREMSQALSVSATLNGAFMGNAASVAASFGYSTETASKQHSVIGWTYATMAVPGIMLAQLENLQLVPGAQQLLAAGDINGFLGIYGTHFIKTRVYGCESSAAYQYSCTSSSARDAIKGSLQGSYDGGSWSASATVSSTFSKYSSSSICTYSGDVYSSGLSTAINPSQDQMLDEQFMDNYFNQFATQCKASSQGSGKLLYVELGNWLEVPAVTAALGNNQTAADLLGFYGTIQPADLYALSVAATYQHKVSVAANALQPAYFTPFATTGFFDRQTNTGMPPVDPSYWANLPTAHQNVMQALGTSGFGNFVNDNAIAAAIASGQTMSQLVQQYFANAKSLYQQAAQTYMYTYSQVCATYIGFDYDDRSPLGSTACVPAGENQAAWPASAGADGYQWVQTANTHSGNVDLTYSIGRTSITTVAGAYKLAAYFGTTKWYNTYRYFDAEPSVYPGHIRQGYYDMTDFFHSAAMCPTCPAPVRMDLSIDYTMRDISYNEDPYLA